MRSAVFIMACLLTLPCQAEKEQSDSDDNKPSALDKRMAIERKTRYQPFVLTPHKPNYILPLSYNSKPNQASFDQYQQDMDFVEIKFQFSVKFPVVDRIIGDKSSLQFAYTNLSFWQAYNDAASYPFRETVHEPEVFLIFESDGNFWGMDTRLIQLGVVHQSNGQAGEQSRTWNRIYLDFILQRDNFYLSFKPWYHAKQTGSARDDNPDIDTFYGHSEIRLAYAGGKHTASMMLRNYLENPDYGALELNWSFPMTRRVKWFMQYFNGYGESLIDYNARSNRVGVGIAFTDWL